MFKSVATATILSLTSMALANSAMAAEDPGFTVSPMIGITKYDDHLDDDNHYSLGLGYRFNNPWSVELVYADSETKLDRAPGSDVDYTRIHLDALYNFKAAPDSAIPYLSFGLGKNDYDVSGGRSDDESMFNLGAGFKYFFLDNTALRGEIKWIHGFDDNEATAAIGLGLHHVFATGQASEPAPKPKPAAKKPADTDGDGVIDDRDACPGTPLGVEVDNRGCPLDSDKDGVANYIDECPDTTDRAATIDKRGCYVVLTEVVTVELNVEFDNDSAAARADHQAEVRRVYEFMKSYPLTKVTIEGHTDDRGSAAYNKNLSQRRANTIANILINDFGVSASRVSAVGYGEEKPIASNNTAAGRQKNRRVVGVVEANVETVRKAR